MKFVYEFCCLFSIIMLDHSFYGVNKIQSVYFLQMLQNIYFVKYERIIIDLNIF